MSAPFYVDDPVKGQTFAFATLAGAQAGAHVISLRNGGHVPPILRPHDVGEYCECDACSMQEDTMPTDCTVCQGIGELAPLVPCPECHGTGYTPRENHTIMRTLQTHIPSGDTFVLEYDGDMIVGVSDALPFSDWREPDGYRPRAGLDLWDFDLHADDAEWANRQQWHAPKLTTEE